MDTSAGRLFRGNDQVKITSQLWALLRCLLERPGELVTPEALAAAAWPDAPASAETVGRTIRRLRSILGDDKAKPIYIEAVHRRGYRFVAPAAYFADEASTAADIFVGRDGEIAALRALLAQSRIGIVRVGLVLGDAGEGKSTLLDRFANEAAASGFRIGRAVCTDAGLGTEPYGALLSVLEGWLRDGDEASRHLLAQRAPTWAAEFGVSAAALDRRRTGSSERMPREALALLAALAEDQPTIVLIDDAQWADAGTIAIVDALSRRRDRAPLLLICAARPHELSLAGCPGAVLAAASADPSRVQPIRLSPLAEDAITDLLRALAVAAADSPYLRKTLYALSGGHPLLASCLIDDWNGRGVIDEIAAGRLAPDISSALAPSHAQSVASLVEHRLALIDATAVEALEAAALAGHTFDSREVAAATGSDQSQDRLFELARRHFLIEPGERDTWPDGTTGQTYRFRHALLRAPLLDRIPPGRRALWHRAFCERLEAGHPSDAAPVLARLLGHSRDFGDTPRTLKYEIEAARRAARRLSFIDAAGHLERALEAASRLPDSPAMQATRPLLIMRQAAALFFGRGAHDDRIDTLTAKASAGAAAAGDQRTAFQAHLIRAGYLMRRGRILDSLHDCQCMVAIADAHQPTLLPSALCLHGAADAMRGRFVAACENFERALLLPGDPEVPADVCMERMIAMYYGITLAVRGFTTLAEAMLARAAAAGERAGNALDQVEVAYYRGICGFRLDDRQAALSHSSHVLELDAEYGFPSYVTGATILRDWGREKASVSAAEKIRSLQLERRQTGELWEDTAYSLMSADAFVRAGQLEEALRINEDGMESSQRTQEVGFLCEQWRQRGSILLARGGIAGVREARTCLRTAIRCAHESDAAFPGWLAAEALATCGPITSDDERSIASARSRLQERQTQRTLASCELVPDARGAV